LGGKRSILIFPRKGLPVTGGHILDQKRGSKRGIFDKRFKSKSGRYFVGNTAL